MGLLSAYVKLHTEISLHLQEESELCTPKYLLSTQNPGKRESGYGASSLWGSPQTRMGRDGLSLCEHSLEAASSLRSKRTKEVVGRRGHTACLPCLLIIQV